MPKRGPTTGPLASCERAISVPSISSNGRLGSCCEQTLLTALYVPAYSTRLKFEDGSWHVMPSNASDPMGEVDPVWTESFWNTIGLRVYTVQSPAYDRLILVAGVILTVSAYAAAIAIRTCLSKALKRD